MMKIVSPLALVALIVLLSLGVSGCKRRDAQTLTAKPNIVFILADDMRKDDLKYMPQTTALLKDQGLFRPLDLYAPPQHVVPTHAASGGWSWRECSEP